MHIPTHYLAGTAICQPRRRRRYLPLLFSFGVVDVAELGELLVDEAPAGEALDEEELVSDDGGVPIALDVLGGVVDELDELLGGGVVEGGVVDDEDVDGEGVTTGGVVVLVVDVSRLQPAIPRTSPVQSSVTIADFISDPP